MIDKQNLAAAVRDRAAVGAPPRTHQSPGRRRWTDVLLHRWPTALGIAVAALSAFGLDDGLEFAALAVLMPLVYLGAAALDRRWSAWAVLLAGLPLAFLLPSTSGVVPSVVLLVTAPVFLVLGVARRHVRSPGGLPLQSAGMLAFGAIALVALSVDAGLGGKLIAIALLGHAAWDAYHFLRNRVVSRSYAEFCGVFDLLLGAAILVMT